MLLDVEQFQRTAALPPGEAYIYGEEWERPRHVILTDFFANHPVTFVTTQELRTKMAESLESFGFKDGGEDGSLDSRLNISVLSSTDPNSRAATSIMLAVLNQEPRLMVNLLKAAALPSLGNTPAEAQPTVCNMFLRLLDKAFPKISSELRLNVYRQFLLHRAGIFRECFNDRTVIAELAHLLGMTVSEVPQDPFHICRLRHGCRCEDLAQNPHIVQLQSQGQGGH